MKAEVILVSQLEDFLKYQRLYRELQVRLTGINERQQPILKELEACKGIATGLRELREKHNFKTDKEMLSIIKKYARKP
jgi:hypothetical protein